jgi:hypothetical protein
MADVFISYKREDRAVVERLSSTLEQLGFEVWWDFELLSGDNFRKAIRVVIDHCAAAVVLWSTRSAESSFVTDEAAYSQRLGKLCPVRIDDVDLPLGFGQLHTTDLSDWDGELSHPGFQGLVKALEERVGRRAKLGAAPGSQNRQTATAELEAFKTAQLAGTVAALRTFTENFPNSVFAMFVRDQIGSMEAESSISRKRAPTRRGVAEPREVEVAARHAAVGPGSADSAPIAPAAPDRGRSRWKLIVLGIATLALLGIGLALFNDAQQRAHEAARAAREQANAVRLAAESRAREMEEQAAADRAARERAERAQVELLQRQADQAARDRFAKEQAAAFNVAALHRDVRPSVEAARKIARGAEAAAERARTAAGAAESAAELARNGAAGTISLTFEGGTYLGEGSGATRSGHGVSIYRAPSKYAGDRYAGQYRDNVRSGVGVYVLAKNPSNTSNALRREGEYSQNKADGLGVLIWVSGDRYAGTWRDGAKSGPGVFRFADGRRYEGGFAGDKRNGLGVLWSAEGRVLSAGIWKDGALVTPLAP